MTSIVDNTDAIGRRLQEIESKREPEAICSTCEGGGWVLSSYQSSKPPTFETCPECANPEGFPCP